MSLPDDRLNGVSAVPHSRSPFKIQMKIERSSERLCVQKNQHVTRLLKIGISELGGSLIGTARKAARNGLFPREESHGQAIFWRA